jgi:hypothetical protein
MPEPCCCSAPGHMHPSLLNPAAPDQEPVSYVMVRSSYAAYRLSYLSVGGKEAYNMVGHTIRANSLEWQGPDPETLSARPMAVGKLEAS